MRVFSLVEIVCGVGLLIVGRVGIFGLVCFRFFRKQQARASAQDSAIGPVFFVEEDLAVARITVIPAGQEPQMFAEFGAAGGGSRGSGFRG